MSDVTLEVGPQWSFGDHTHDLAALGLEQGSQTDRTLTLAATSGLADDAARESQKADLGANRPPRISVDAAIEWFSAPTTGERVDFYWAPSHDATAADGNPGYVTGADGDYDGGVATLDEGLAQLTFVGSMIVSADAAVQKQHVGTFVPVARYGTLVVVNRSGAVICGTDDEESNVVLTGITDDVA